MPNRLFVYGTLAPGRSNEHVLASVPGKWVPAKVYGRLFDEGWGAAEGYPGIILDETGEEVLGLIFESQELPVHWDRLDAFEGEGYVRVLTSAKLEDGRTVETFIYELTSKSPRDRR